MRRLTTEEFIAKAIKIHGNKYGYDKVHYITSATPVIITCPVHGDFEQIPNSHLSGKGCKRCGCSKSKNKLVCGVGLNDVGSTAEEYRKSYLHWYYMLSRCYSLKDKVPTYKDCEVCEDWKCFSVFHKWFVDNYIEGYQLDKDILIKGNKEYGAATCCFVPQEINLLLVNRKRFRGEYPVGVSKMSEKSGSKGFIARVEMRGRVWRSKVVYTPEEAFVAYKQAKEAYIKQVARKYYDEGKITERVYDALMRYEVEITD